MCILITNKNNTEEFLKSNFPTGQIIICEIGLIKIKKGQVKCVVSTIYIVNDGCFIGKLEKIIEKKKTEIGDDDRPRKNS